ncbi:MFS transporter [Thermopolyspora sp. NPDC052614]|uniref:MFS transporter n=1 Tax=Thermopolyspora sp. NPDC052614 TaxID=3155682 RepID=UPI00342EEBC1
MAGAWERARRTASGVAKTTARAGRKTFRAGRAAAHTTARAGRGIGQATRRLTHAQGAGRTGLGRLIEVTATHSAGDAFVTVALAGTLFFGLPVNQARGQVALYLLITMAPFAVVAPFVGPVLDRFRSGRRYVMAGTMFARGLLCWAMAAAVGPADTFTLFPAALAVLVLSKAYNVSRAAIMPSVLPPDVTLVRANARVTLFALVAAGAGAALSTGLTAWLGAAWVLRGTMVLFLAAGVATVRLPRHVDSPDIEDERDEYRDEYAAPGETRDAGDGPDVSDAPNVGCDAPREPGDAAGTRPYTQPGAPPVADDGETLPGLPALRPADASAADRTLPLPEPLHEPPSEPQGDHDDHGAHRDTDDHEDHDASRPAEEVGAFAEQGNEPTARAGRRQRLRALLDVGPAVAESMYANIATRVQGGFLLFFLLFLVQEGGLPGLSTEVTIAVLAAAAGAGGLLSSSVASWMRGRSPQLIVLVTLALATVTTVVGAFLFTLWSAVAVAAVAAFAQNLGKLALDAIVQHEVDEQVRSSTFGVVESVLQIGWVGGGLLGLLLSGFVGGPAGFGVMSTGLVVTLVWLIVNRRRRVVAARAARREARRQAAASSDRQAATEPLTQPRG